MLLTTEAKKKSEELMEKFWMEEIEKATLRRKSRVPKRNEPCFCGSGKKFKICCWLLYIKEKGTGR